MPCQLFSNNKADATTQVGIVGKYGTRYGSRFVYFVLPQRHDRSRVELTSGTMRSHRKVVKKLEIAQHSTYECAFCGSSTVKRSAAGIWKCKKCSIIVAGGAFTLSTSSAAQVRTALARSKRQQAKA